MPVSIPIQYDDLFEFLEDYREAISQLRYTIPVDEPLTEGEEVAVQFWVPVLDETITVHGRVGSCPEEDLEELVLDPDHGDGIPRLEGFYRFIGKLVEEMLVSGRFKVAGQWSAGAGPALGAGGSQVAAAVATADGSKVDTAQFGAPHSTGAVEEEAMTTLMMDLYRSKAIGVLEVKAETGRRLGWMKQGGFIQWENDPIVEDECLGVLLARAGKLTEDQLKISLKRMNETGQKQGECLIEMGALTFPQLVMSLMTQTEIVTRNVFAMTDGTWSWFPMDALPGSFVTPPMKTPGFLFAYYKRTVAKMTPLDIERMQAPLMDQYTVMAPDVNWDDLRMKKIEHGLVEILRKRSYRYRELNSVSNMGRGPTLQVLLALIKLGVLMFKGAEDREQVMDRLRKQLVTKLQIQGEQNPFELLEAHWTSRTPQVTESHARMRAEYERFGRGKDIDPDIEEKRVAILANIDKAFEALADKATRQETRKRHYEPQQHEFSADLLFKQGEMLMVRSKWGEAIEDFERAAELMPTNNKYKQMLAQAKRQAGGSGDGDL